MIKRFIPIAAVIALLLIPVFNVQGFVTTPYLFVAGVDDSGRFFYGFGGTPVMITTNYVDFDNVPVWFIDGTMAVARVQFNLTEQSVFVEIELPNNTFIEYYNTVSYDGYTFLYNSSTQVMIGSPVEFWAEDWSTFPPVFLGAGDGGVVVYYLRP